jgi:hypothetical protein
MPLPGRRQRLPDEPILHKLKWRAQFVGSTVARYTFRRMRDLTMKPIFSLMGIACSQLA